MTHKEIKGKLGVPRPTVTRWFRQFGVPCQSFKRMTKKRWQIRLIKTLKHIKKQKFQFDPPCLANKHFFKEWSPEMAYILGYFVADGCMFVNPRGSHYIEFTSTDRESIQKIKTAMHSQHSIGEREYNNPNWKIGYRLQIGSKEMFRDLSNLGFQPNKSKVVRMPTIPKRFLSHFIRGYFDGDGSIFFGAYKRNDRTTETLQFRITTSFASGSKEFLKDLQTLILKNTNLKGGCLSKKSKDKEDFQLAFSTSDSEKMFQFMYNGATKDYFLERKFNKFQEAFQKKRAWSSLV